MNYYRVEWNEIGENPVLFYSEIDDGRWEKRKIEIFKDGSIGIAGLGEEGGGSYLSVEPWPSHYDLGVGDSIVVSEISCEAFEEIWRVSRFIFKARL